MIFIQWVSDRRIIPGHGIVETDEIIGLPNDLAKKFIDQGEAKIIISKAKKAEDKQ